MKTAEVIRFAAMTLLLLLLTQHAGAWSGSGTQDSPYLIASTADWNSLATNVNGGTTYSGKYFRLTADISVTTMVGNSENNSFRGTFDGNGHTLTISYNTSDNLTAPFRYIQGASFKNLKVTGSITTTGNQAAGIAGLNTVAPAYFDQCVTAITINSNSTTFVDPWSRYDYHGGFLARSNNVDVYITDCVSGGSIDGSSSTQSNCASFVGVVQNCTVSATRCLSTITYTNVASFNSLCHTANSTRSANVFYFVNGNDTNGNVGTQVTTSQLADGSYATALQADHSTTVWIQYAAINQPMLKLFALNQANDGYYLIGSEQEWRNFATLVKTTPSANARMTADFSVTTMVGVAVNANDGNDNDDIFYTFNGVYDGDGHTLNLNIAITGERYVGPFHCVSGATIKNLIVTGSVAVSGGNTVESTRHPSALIGCCRTGSVVIENCLVSANVSGADYMGGLIGHSWDANVSIRGCVYNGTLTASGTNCTGGLIGWGGDHGGVTFAFTNNLFAGSYSGSGRFHPIGFLASVNNNTRTVSSTYYTAGPQNVSANDSNSLVKGLSYQGTLATPPFDKPANLGTKTTGYSVSGITMYSNGLSWNGQYYCGSPEYNYTLTLTSATVLGEAKYVTTFYHGTLAYQLPAGALAYTAGKVDGKVVFYRIGPNSNVIPADTAVIIVADTEGPLTLTKLSSTDVTAKADNLLSGSDTDVTVQSGTAYVLGVAGGVLGFYPITGNTIPAGKAYYVN